MQTDAQAYPTEYAVTFGPFCVCPERHLLLKHGRPVPLGERALAILIALLEQAGKLVTKDQLVARAWPNRVIEESNLRVQVAVLRKALHDGHDESVYIAAVPGRGYRFVAATVRAGDPTVSGGSRALLNNLPTRLTPVIGRADVVEVLVSRLRRRRLVTIVGPGGIGKTTVAISVAADLSASYRDGVWLVDLAPLTDATLVPSVLAAMLGLALTTRDPAEELFALLRDKRILLILDNCERLIEGAALLAERILQAAPGVDILATSRETLRAEGESVHRLSPLETPPAAPGLTAAMVLSFSAVELFVERVTSSIDGFRICDADAPVIADLCRQLDGIALAIELAAARVSAFGVRGVAQRLDDRFRILVGGRRTAVPRHQTLAAVLDWSYALLTEAQRAILCRLGAFAGGFTLESVCRVARDTAVSERDIPDILADLVAKSLVCVQDAPLIRYRLLDTTRAYAITKFSASTEFAAISRQHAEYFRDLFERSVTEWPTRPTHEWLNSYVPETDNVRSALDWAYSSRGDASIGMALTVAAIPLWFQLSSTEECRRRVEHALANAGPEAIRTAHARQVMQLYAALGMSQTFTIGLAPRATAAWMKAFEIAESLDDAESRLEALWGRWFCHIGLGEYSRALETAHQFCRHANSLSDLATGDQLVGIPLHCLGHGTTARHHMERSLSRQGVFDQSTDSIRFTFNQPLTARMMLAQMLWLAGLPDQAVDAIHINAQAARESAHAISRCDALAQSAFALAIFTGEWAMAEDCVAEMQEQASRHALAPWKVLAQCLSAVLLVKRGRLDPGVSLLASGLQSLRQVGFAIYHTSFLGTLAEGLAMAGQTAGSHLVIDEALELCRQRGELWCIAELLRLKGEMLCRGGITHLDLAEQHLAQSLEQARRQGALSWELRTATSLARLWRLQGRHQKARDSLVATYNRFAEGFATQDLRTAKQLIDELS